MNCFENLVKFWFSGKDPPPTLVHLRAILNPSVLVTSNSQFTRKCYQFDPQSMSHVDLLITIPVLSVPCQSTIISWL